LLVLGLVHQYQEVGSPMAKYRDLAVGSGASWFGLPGPAEALLVAAGVLAAERQLDLVWVVALSWLGAIGGAIAGWLMGLAVGRRLFVAPGPLLGVRRRMLTHGDRTFERHPVLAILWAPTPLAGIHRVRPARFLTVTVAGTAVWSASISVGAYVAGPGILHAVDAGGTVAVGGLMLLLVGGIVVETVRRRRRRSRSSSSRANPRNSPARARRRGV
jgi:membrane protein DedA with SNARE-associated domain